MLLASEINDVTDSQMMLYFRIFDGIVVHPFRIMKQWWTDEEQGNIDGHRLAVQVGLLKLRAIYILKHAWCLFISIFLADSYSYISGT